MAGAFDGQRHSLCQSGAAAAVDEYDVFIHMLDCEEIPVIYALNFLIDVLGCLGGLVFNLLGCIGQARGILGLEKRWQYRAEHESKGQQSTRVNSCDMSSKP
jgi:hypothetical protein